MLPSPPHCTVTSYERERERETGGKEGEEIERHRESGGERGRRKPFWFLSSLFAFFFLVPSLEKTARDERKKRVDLRKQNFVNTVGSYSFSEPLEKFGSTLWQEAAGRSRPEKEGHGPEAEPARPPGRRSERRALRRSCLSRGRREDAAVRMSAERMPSKSEVMGWNPQRLADYLKRMSLSGCDKVVLKNSISGARFVNLSENDLQKFPKLHAPMISKISAEISKKEERRHFFGIFPSKNQEADAVTDVQGWDEGEFDDEEFDDDYESPFSGDEEGSGGDYESPNDDQDAANDYEPPPSEPPEDLPRVCPTLPIGEGGYIDNPNHPTKGPPPVLCPRPPVSTLSAPSLRMHGDPSSSRRDHSPHTAGRAAGKPPAEPPQIFREDKPGRGPHPNTSGTHSRRPQPDVPDHPAWSKPPVLPPNSVNRSNSSARPPPNKFDSRREQTRDEAPKHNTFPLHIKNQPLRPGLPGPPSRHGDSLPPNVTSGGSLPQKLHSALAEQRDRQPFRPPPSIQELDPSWYVGNVTRGQAENCLKRVRKDGAYLVRDSTRQLANQPFTLMVFYQDKVYNIQIRQQNQQFLLGTGLKVHESFPSVSDIISHYSQSPLLLIDAKNRGSSQQNQCLLSDPAGYYMGRPNWT